MLSPIQAQFDPALLRAAGLRPQHLQHFFGVSRQVASRWMNGNLPPGHDRMPDMLRLQASVAAALEAGRLPVKAGRLTKAGRFHRELVAIESHLEQAEPAGGAT